MSETPKFSQRHFEFIAETISGLSVDAECRRAIRRAFSDRLEATNDRFKRGVFERACTPADEFEAEIAPMIEQLSDRRPEYSRRYEPLRVDDVAFINDHVVGIFDRYDTPTDVITAMNRQLRTGLDRERLADIRSTISALVGKHVRMLMLSVAGDGVYFRIVTGEVLAPKHGGHNIEIAEDGLGTGRRSLFSFSRFAGVHVTDSKQTIGVSK